MDSFENRKDVINDFIVVNFKENVYLSIICIEFVKKRNAFSDTYSYAFACGVSD